MTQPDTTASRSAKGKTPGRGKGAVRTPISSYCRSSLEIALFPGYSPPVCDSPSAILGLGRIYDQSRPPRPLALESRRYIPQKPINPGRSSAKSAVIWAVIGLALVFALLAFVDNGSPSLDAPIVQIGRQADPAQQSSTKDAAPQPPPVDPPPATIPIVISPPSLTPAIPIAPPPAPKPIDLTTPRGTLTQAEIVRVQRLLALLGYAPGFADGHPGQRTRAAIERFQSDLGLPVTGAASLELLSALQLSASSSSAEKEKLLSASPEMAQKFPAPYIARSTAPSYLKPGQHATVYEISGKWARLTATEPHQWVELQHLKPAW